MHPRLLLVLQCVLRAKWDSSTARLQLLPSRVPHGLISGGSTPIVSIETHASTPRMKTFRSSQGQEDPKTPLLATPGSRRPPCAAPLGTTSLSKSTRNLSQRAATRDPRAPGAAHGPSGGWRASARARPPCSRAPPARSGPGKEISFHFQPRAFTSSSRRFSWSTSEAPRSHPS